jgi:hypothetical protein
MGQYRISGFSKCVSTNLLSGRTLTHNTDLQHRMDMAQMEGESSRYRQLAPLVATAEGRFDFSVPGYLNQLNPDIRPTKFRDWFLHNWASIP